MRLRLINARTGQRYWRVESLAYLPWLFKCYHTDNGIDYVGEANLGRR